MMKPNSSCKMGPKKGEEVNSQAGNYQGFENLRQLLGWSSASWHADRDAKPVARRAFRRWGIRVQ